MNRLQTVTALGVIAGVLLASMPAHAFETPEIAGSWKLEKKKFAIAAVMYTTLLKDGSCTQILRVSAMGTTRWAVDRCAWSIQQSELSMRVLSSPTQPDKVGEASTTTIKSVTPDTLLTEDAKKQTQIWSRVPAWPAEFTAEFEKAYAASANDAH